MILILLLAMPAVLFGCDSQGILHDDTEWRFEKNADGTPKYDVTLPDFSSLKSGKEQASADGWYTVFIDDFETEHYDGEEIAGLNPEIWCPSPHAIRSGTDFSYKPENNSYWCSDTISVKDGTVRIRSFKSDDHNCTQGKCPKRGRFSGGIETRKIYDKEQTLNTGSHDKLLFAQKFGYFEARVKFPDESGVWSAFWLQSSTQRNIGDNGRDGTEIDVYESAFIRHPDFMGHALIWDGYGKESRTGSSIIDAGKNLFEGFHTFGLKWTPDYYVFYIDGEPTWASDAGGVSQIPQYLRLTVEIDNGNGCGPHGQPIGQFCGAGSVFYIDYVKVYQNIFFK